MVRGRALTKIFLADDSPQVIKRLRELISGIGGFYIVGDASNVPAATETILELKPDVVILDFRMPGGDALDILEVIKLRKPAPFVIILTNYSYPEYRKRCLAAGADLFLDKSKDFGRLTDKLQELVSTHFK